MNTISKTTGIDMKILLSTLWIFVLFNIIFRDIHEFFRVGLLAEIMTGTVNSVQLTEQTMLVAGIMMEIPIAMVLLSRVLPYRVNRWANIIGGVIGIGFVISTEWHDLDDLFFAVIMAVTAVVIIWLAWRWPNPELIPDDKHPAA